jgi:hypothetical protein
MYMSMFDSGDILSYLAGSVKAQLELLLFAVVLEQLELSFL